LLEILTTFIICKHRKICVFLKYNYSLDIKLPFCVGRNKIHLEEVQEFCNKFKTQEMVLTLKLLSGGAYVGHNVGHVSKHCGEQQQSEKKLCNNEQVLGLAAGAGQVPDGGEGERTPVVTLQVLLDHVRTFGITKHPVLAAEAVVLINYVVQTPVPMEYH